MEDEWRFGKQSSLIEAKINFVYHDPSSSHFHPLSLTLTAFLSTKFENGLFLYLFSVLSLYRL